MKVNVLIDNHLHAGMDAYRLPDFAASDIEQFIDSVRPSRLTVFAIGHDGLAQYPSNLAKVAPGLPFDLVGFWRDVARKRGIAFGIYVSTLRNDVLLTEQPAWVRYRLDGATSGKIDHTSPYLAKWLKPVLSEIYKKYKPDSFFFDGDYWAVGESISEPRARAAQLRWPTRGETALSTLSPEEHRLLTVETYTAYLRELGTFLRKLDKRLLSSVNLAFTFRHPTAPPIGLNLVTSDLPPFYGALEAWIETAVLLRADIRRDLVVPLYAEPEGGGRKYPKSVPQLIHETAPIVAHGDPVHVYFPMSRRGRIDQAYVGSLNEMRARIEGDEQHTTQTDLQSDFDVLCLSDSDAMQRSQDFSSVRGAFLAASAAGLNVGVASTQRCADHLARMRLLIIPSGQALSAEAIRLVEAAEAAGVVILGPDLPGFKKRMVSSNWSIDQQTMDLVADAYHASPKSTLWSDVDLERPWTTFARGLTASDGSWRLFLWNGVKNGFDMGRHVRDEGAGFAGPHRVSVPGEFHIGNVWGHISALERTDRSVSFHLNGAFAVVEGTSPRTERSQKRAWPWERWWRSGRA
ncbi:alpha-L-fucosidase [Methylobacterium sp. Leaf94]|uniref:alpha-L-fucosidase n=1 Tax=Methylobacterium sp. Leaf94 TaxID=1736250 RepID=UPI000AF59D15|nr:alpha-L-fucosidase [Methylobacterium sp. Leaf94]